MGKAFRLYLTWWRDNVLDADESIFSVVWAIVASIAFIAAAIILSPLCFVLYVMHFAMAGLCTIFQMPKRDIFKAFKDYGERHNGSAFIIQYRKRMFCLVKLDKKQQTED